MKLACPHCGILLDVSAVSSGTKVVCPKCRKPLIVSLPKPQASSKPAKQKWAGARTSPTQPAASPSTQPATTSSEIPTYSDNEAARWLEDAQPATPPSADSNVPSNTPPNLNIQEDSAYPAFQPSAGIPQRKRGNTSISKKSARPRHYPAMQAVKTWYKVLGFFLIGLMILEMLVVVFAILNLPAEPYSGARILVSLLFMVLIFLGNIFSIVSCFFIAETIQIAIDIAGDVKKLVRNTE